MKPSFLARGWVPSGLVLFALVAGILPPSGYAQVPNPFIDPTLGAAVRITSPANHATFYTPVEIPIFVYTRSEARFTNVEFYANGVALGHAVSLATTNRTVVPTLGLPFATPVSSVLSQMGSVWCLVWSNAPAGAYALTAVAEGAQLLSPRIGVNQTSAVVNVTIVAAVPGTNALDAVDIVATDPVAIAGTNSSWVWAGPTNAVPAWTNWPPLRWGYATNWGPKSALFTVRRSGTVTAPLSVNYQVSGTASNGVDYAALPGVVNFPAGVAYALIPVVPVDNGSNNVTKTVILTLPPATNLPPNYTVGFPPQATAIIRYFWPRPLPWSLPLGGLHLNASGPDGAWFAVQHSADLARWTSLGTNQVFHGSVDFVEPSPAGSAGFYRILPLTNRPAP